MKLILVTKTVILTVGSGSGYTAGSPSTATVTIAPSPPPQVSIGGTSLPIIYAGLAPGEVGVYQINAKVPSTVPLGLSLSMKINQGSASTSVPVRVVE